MNSDPDKEDIEQSNHIGDLLVQTGLASRVSVNATTRIGQIYWTPEGSAFRGQILEIFDTLNAADPKTARAEFLTLMVFLVAKDPPPSLSRAPGSR